MAIRRKSKMSEIATQTVFNHCDEVTFFVMIQDSNKQWKQSFTSPVSTNEHFKFSQDNVTVSFDIPSTTAANNNM